MEEFKAQYQVLEEKINYFFNLSESNNLEKQKVKEEYGEC